MNHSSPVQSLADDLTLTVSSPADPSAHRVCLTWALPEGPGRAQVAQRLLAELVERWALPPVRSQRWLAPAADVLTGPGELELCVQLDRISQLVTVELWSDSHVVFGIDDWIGV